MERRVVHVSREKEQVLHAGRPERREQARDLLLTPSWGAVALAYAVEGARHAPGPVVVREDEPDRHVGRHDLPRGPRAREAVDEPAELRLAEERGALGLVVRAVGAPVASPVEEEELGARAPHDAPVERGARPEGDVLVHGPGGTRHEDARVALGVALVGAALPGPEVVPHLVVVPNREEGHVRGELAHVLAQKRVGERVAKILKRFGDMRLPWGDQVLPHGAVRQGDLRGQGSVGVDEIACMHEELRLRGMDGAVAREPAARDVDAEALADRVAGPREANLSVERRGRGGAGRSERVRAARLSERRAETELLAGGQAVAEHLRGEVPLRAGDRPEKPLRARERRVARGRDVDHEALSGARGLGARPEDDRASVHVSRLNGAGSEARGGARSRRGPHVPSRTDAARRQGTERAREPMPP